jgi:hypothetical protein
MLPGVILGKQIGNWIAGANYDPEIISNGDWTDFLPEHEVQNNPFETSACTVFSMNDVKETLFMWALHNNKVPASYVLWLNENGYFRNGFINFDDNTPAMFADITIGVGTFMYKAAEAVRKWSVPEGILGQAQTVQEYYNKERLTQKAIDLQKEFDKRFFFNWFWTDDLRVSPLSAVVPFANGEGILCPTTPFNHAVLEYKRDDVAYIEDSYIQRFKKYCLPRVTSRLGFKLTILKNDMDTTKWLKDNDKKWVRNQNTGGFGRVLQNKLFTFETKDRAALALLDDRVRENGVQINNDLWLDLPQEKF